MTPLPLHQLLDSYEHLVQVTARMREAAAQDDWDQVIALESECSAMYSVLMSAHEASPMDEQYVRRKSELICKLLEDDAEIRERISGQLTHIWRMIDGRSQVERLSSAYGAAHD
jgi:flagellar protein FliT